MVKYVSYYDCTNWNSSVEVMNVQDERADYVITVYERAGAMVWTDIRTLTPHETERIVLDPHAPHDEGLVIVEAKEQGQEFPALLTIYDTGRDWRVANRFVPFIRVP